MIRTNVIKFVWHIGHTCCVRFYGWNRYLIDITRGMELDDGTWDGMGWDSQTK